MHLAIVFVSVAVSVAVSVGAVEIAPNMRRFLDNFLAREDTVSSLVPDTCRVSIKCPDGSTAVQSSLKNKPDGCGTGGLYLPPPSDAQTECCDLHDMCYGTCGMTRRACDNEFKKCLAQKCRSVGPANRISCELTSELFSLATYALGCAAFEDAQQKACDCPPSSQDGDDNNNNNNNNNNSSNMTF